GVEKELVASVRKHDRSLIPPFGDQASALPDFPLLSHQLGATLGRLGDRFHGRGDLGTADGARNVLAVARDAMLVDLDAARDDHPGDLARIHDPEPLRLPRDGTKHRSGIEEAKAEAPGHDPRDGRLPRAGGTVDGEDYGMCYFFRPNSFPKSPFFFGLSPS